MFNRVHSYSFIRQGRMGIENVCLLTITDKEEIEPRSDHDAIHALKGAITQWVENTAEGQEAYQASAEDYNIGDFMGDFQCQSIEPFIAKAGIESLDMETLTEEQICTYDEHLVG